MQTDESDEQTDSMAAEKWLALVDSGDFAQSWDQSASMFRDGVHTTVLFNRGMSEERWQSSAAALQTQLGKAESRSLRSKRYTEELPDEPDRACVVLEYETSFGGQQNVVKKVRWGMEGIRLQGHRGSPLTEHQIFATDKIDLAVVEKLLAATRDSTGEICWSPIVGIGTLPWG